MLRPSTAPMVMTTRGSQTKTNYVNQAELIKRIKHLPNNMQREVFGYLQAIVELGQIYNQKRAVDRATGNRYATKIDTLNNRLKAYFKVQNNSKFMNDVFSLVENFPRRRLTRSCSLEKFYKKYQSNTRTQKAKELFQFLDSKIPVLPPRPRPRRKSV